MARSKSTVNLSILALVLFATVLNFFPIPFFTGSALVFGNVLAVAVTILFGLRLGLLTSLIASLATFTSWGHLLIVLPFLIEVLVVKWSLKRHHTPLFYGVLYWFTLGWIIVGIEYYWLTDYLELTKIAIVVKYIVNGVLNVSLGYLVAHVLNHTLQLNRMKPVRLSSFIALTIFYSVTISVLANAYYWLRTTQDNKLQELESQMALEATHVGIQLNNLISGGVRTMTLLADLESEHEAFDQSRVLTRLDYAARQHPNFLTMLAADKVGQVVAAYPADLMAKVDDSFNVAERSYFYLAKATLRPVISEVFLGKGFGSDPIVGLSAPIMREGRFDGIVEASLNLSMFKDLDSQLIDESQSLLILDEHNRVIYRSESSKIGFLQDMSESELLRHINEPESYFYISDMGEYEIVQSKIVEELDWRVVVVVPRAFYEYQISSYVATSLLILVLFILVLFFIASRLALRVSQPISDLARQISWASQNKKFEFIELNMQASLITELNEMSPVIQRFAGKLQRTLQRLSHANSQTEKANKDLEALNRNLAAEVEEQTQALRLALNEATHANNAKSSFLATMSHEIRTPMNGVIGMLDILSQDKLSNSQRESVDIAKSSASTLLSLINDILDFSKLDAGKIAFEHIAFDLNALLKDVVATQQHLSENPDLDITLDTRFDGEFWVKGDPTRVRQVVVNLVSNAIKFTQKGEVKISACDLKKVDGKNLIQIRVKDTGIGIKPEHLTNLFNPFTQADASTTRKYGGTGLGLSIAKQLCNLMAGDLTAKSQVNRGSEFEATLLLPAAEACPNEVNKAIDEKLKQEKVSKHILLVEDNLINQTVATKMLKNLGHTITVAGNGIEALEALKQRQDFDLVLMDCQMPEMDGFEATALIRQGLAGESAQNILIIALTANAMKGDKERCLEAGMDKFLTKPIELDQLELALIEGRG